jgi:uncharacterized membrane protein YeaQ/YmgE (transglycosylase-associated protein family)
MFLILWVLFVALGGWVGSTKNRTGMGIVLGLLLGLIGVLIIALVPPAEPDNG